MSKKQYFIAAVLLSIGVLVWRAPAEPEAPRDTFNSFAWEHYETCIVRRTEALEKIMSDSFGVAKVAVDCCQKDAREALGAPAKPGLCEGKE